MSIALGADHAGFGLKQVVAAYLVDSGHQVIDCGTDGPKSVDYPDFAHAVCAKLIQGQARFGVLICGTGIGMSITANRYPDIRCALAHDVTSARLARAHNDANIIAFGGRLIGEEVARDILQMFLSTPFEGGRHERRLAKLSRRN